VEKPTNIRGDAGSQSVNQIGPFMKRGMTGFMKGPG
jgi:hypothetical protein